MSEWIHHSGSFCLVALDLDGTLLDERGEVTRRALAAVHAVVDAGVVVALATSRRYASTVPVAEALDLRGPLILYDGALIRAHPSGAILASEELARDVAAQAVAAISAHELRPVVQYADAVGERPETEGRREAPPSRSEAGERLLVAPPLCTSNHERDYVDRFWQQITVVPLPKLTAGAGALLRIVAFGPLEHLRAAAETMASLPCGWQLLPLGNYGAAELSIFAATASKGNALRRLAGHLGISLAQTLAIGDGVNDVSLLAAAGLGIAMGNAAPEVLAVADEVTASNAEDGAALALERHVLAASQQSSA